MSKPAAHLDPAPPTTRLLSLDVYRGLIMFLLVGEGAAFYYALQEWDVPWLRPIVHQFHHVPWQGLVLWDLIQPGFMFIVGVAMVFSLRKRRERGERWSRSALHIVIRCAVLFLLGTGLHCVYNMKPVFELWNVLTQLSFTILVTFLIFRLPWTVQFAIALGLILLTDLAYRLIHIAPYDATFEPGRNFGAWVDMQLMGKIDEGHWVAVNAVPTAAHTIWGALCGQLLAGRLPEMKKVGVLVAGGLALLIVGYAMDAAGLAPIVKRICTSSFVIVSGGWCVLALGFFYLVHDVWRVRLGTWFVVVVGLNPIFIYMTTELLAWGWLNPRVGVFVGQPLAMLGMNEAPAAVATAGVTWALLWGLCVWLYRKRIFIRI